MFSLTGRVVIEETGLGIQHLVVSAFDAQGDLDLTEIVGVPDLATAVGVLNRRVEGLGSAVTRADGSFSLTCPTAPAAPAPVRRLLLIVTTPESPSNNGGRVLYVTPAFRIGAAEYQTYVIRLDEARLKGAGVLHPFHNKTADATVISAELAARDRSHIRQALTAAAAPKIAGARDERKRYKRFQKRFIRNISRLPKKRIGGDLLVLRGESVEAKNEKAVSIGVDKRINAARLRTRYYLTETQMEALNNALSPDGTIAFSTLRSSVLLGNGESNPVTPQLIRHNQAILECLDKIREESDAGALLNGGLPGTERGGRSSRRGLEGGVVRGGGVVVSIADDLPRFVAQLMPGDIGDNQSSIGARPSKESIDEAIATLTLQTGPADQPAFFDFHTLQIAFEHVWQELINDDVLKHAEALHYRLGDLGGDVDAGEHRGKTALNALQDETAVVEATLRRRENPTAKYRRDGRPIEPNGAGAGGIAEPPTGDPKPGYDPSESGLTQPGIADHGELVFPQPNDLLTRLQDLLSTPYAFTVFAANEKERSVNFGVIATYRQQWVPTAYQVGGLIRSIPLTPKQTQKIVVTRTKKRSVVRNQVDKASSMRRQESSDTSRAEDEIVRKARAKTNFNLQADGTYNIGIAEGASETTLGKEAENDSSETKKDFREAVFKAAQEYKNENILEVKEESSSEETETVTSEISNPNDELCCTFLFYELQRRYRVHEELHRLMPVVLVAQEVPSYDQITDAWLIAHDWVLKRTLLDDSFRPALDYLVARYYGDQKALSHVGLDVTLHRKVVGELRESLVALKRKEASTYEHLNAAIEERARQAKKEQDGFWSDVGEFFGGGGESHEHARILEDAARDAVERAAAQVKELTMRLEREVSALQAASDRYEKLLQDHNNWKVQIERLKLHVKDHLLHYMQGIWTHEVPDQRYFRLFQVKVPDFADSGTFFTLTDTSSDKIVTSSDGEEVEEATGVDFEITPQLTANFGDKVKSLVEVADLDKLLGFKGNYAIFPLKKSNPLTDILMDPYVNAGFGQILGLFDPDEAGNMSRQDFAKFVVCLHEKLGEEKFDEIKEALKSQYQRLLLAANRPGEEIIVPSGSLYVEALPGSHPLLENFKLLHRQIDVQKARAGVLHDQLENVRLAARLLGSEEHPLLLEDAEIEKKIVVEGQGSSVIVSPEDE